MATPSPAEIKRLQDAHERLIERLDATHGRRLEGVLESLEAEIERLVGEGKITPAEAINKRVTIEAAIRGTFLTWADESVRDYDNVAAGVVAMMQKLGSIEGFVAADAATVNQLKHRLCRVRGHCRQVCGYACQWSVPKHPCGATTAGDRARDAASH